jgi:AcrR family transcriptional regulator
MSLCAPSDSASGDSPASPELPLPPRRSPGDPPRVFVTHNLHERIQAAAARTIAARGYQESTVEDICSEAEISEKAFYEHFKDKQAVAMSALEAAVDQMMMDLRETFKAAPTWPEAIWDTTVATLDWMVREPAFTRLGLIAMPVAGEAGLELLQSLMDVFGMFLEPGYALAPAQASSRRLVDEAVANAVFGRLHECVLREGLEGVAAILPELVRTILTPFLGAEAASAFVAQRSTRG